jgi:hypothetical protein
MPPPAQRRQESRSFPRIARLAKDAAAQRHRRIRTKHDVIRTGHHRRRLLARQTRGIGPGQFALPGVLVDIGRQDRIRHDAKLRQKLFPARAARSEDQPHLKR